MIKVIIHFNNGDIVEYETKTSKELLCERFNINYFNKNDDNTQILIIGNKSILINKSNINYIEFEE